MKFRIFSDVHAEFFNTPSYQSKKFERVLNRYIPETAEDHDTILLCAGDMGVLGGSNSKTSFMPVMKLLGKRFKEVICIPGNHEYYGTVGLFGNIHNWWKEHGNLNNVTLLENQYKCIGNICIIGCTLWTDFQGYPVARLHAESVMNDFKQIKTGILHTHTEPYVHRIGTHKTITTADMIDEHSKSVEFIKEALRYCTTARMTPVVLTHHAPSFASVASRFKGDLLNSAFASDLSALIFEYAPAYWVHGHMHDSADYTLGNCRVLCNPLGYHGYEINRMFNSSLSITID